MYLVPYKMQEIKIKSGDDGKITATNREIVWCMGLGAGMPGFKSCHCHLIAERPWAGYLTSWGPHFLSFIWGRGIHTCFYSWEINNFGGDRQRFFLHFQS